MGKLVVDYPNASRSMLGIRRLILLLVYPGVGMTHELHGPGPNAPGRTITPDSPCEATKILI